MKKAGLPVLGITILVLGIFSQSTWSDELQSCAKTCKPQRELEPLTSHFSTTPSTRKCETCDGQGNVGEPLTSVPSSLMTPDQAARMILGISYGSCGAAQKPPLDLADANEIAQNNSQMNRRVTTVENGRGSLRLVKKKAADQIEDFHYYIQDRVRSPCQDRTACKKLSRQNPEPFTEDYCLKRSCRALDRTPLYQFGARPFTNSDGELVLDPKVGSFTSGMDCSGFVSSAFLMSGRKFYPASSTSAQDWLFTTASMSRLGSSRDCMRKLNAIPRAEAALEKQTEELIRPGDIIVSPDNHVVMVDLAGPDPLGVDRVVKELSSELASDWANSSLNQKASHNLIRSIEHSCNRSVSSSDFQLTIIHDSSRNGNLGIQREKASPALAGGTLGTGLLHYARQACKNRLLARITTGQSPEQMKKLIKTAPWRKTKPAASILRHDPNKLPGCTRTPASTPKAVGQECFSCCNVNQRYGDFYEK